jgi:hypothetical protein
MTSRYWSVNVLYRSTCLVFGVRFHSCWDTQVRFPYCHITFLLDVEHSRFLHSWAWSHAHAQCNKITTLRRTNFKFPYCRITFLLDVEHSRFLPSWAWAHAHAWCNKITSLRRTNFKFPYCHITFLLDVNTADFYTHGHERMHMHSATKSWLSSHERLSLSTVLFTFMEF